MSKLLQKLLKAAIFPAALMIVSKLVGMYLANRVFDLGWYIETSADSLFSVHVVYPDFESALICNSYSNATMVIAMLIGTGVNIFQGYFLHSSHQNPKVLVKLVQFDFIIWLTESSALFPRMIVWLTFLWISTVIAIAQALQSFSYPWVAVFALVSSVMATWLAARDFETEMKTIFPENDRLKVN